MAIHRFYDRDMAVGLTWLAPILWSASGRERRKVHNTLSLEMEAVGYAQIDMSSGYQLGATTNPQELGLESAAALLAHAQQSVVLIEHLGNDQFWLCSIEDGAVFPAGDLIGNKDLIAERLKEIRSDIAGTSIPVYDKFDSFGIDNAVRQDFVELVKNITPKSDIACKQVQKRKLNKPALGAAIGIVLICASAGTWHYFKRADSIEERQEIQEQTSQHTYEQERFAVQHSLDQNTPALLATFADTIFNRPLRAAGWRTHAYEWQDDAVSVIWHRDHGTVLDISEHLGNRQYEVTDSAESVTENFDFPASTRLETDKLEYFLGDRTDRMLLLDSLAAIPGNWSLTMNQRIGNQFRVVRSHLRGSGNQIHQMISSALRLKNQPIHLTRIKVTLGNSFHWELEGHYYATAD